MPPLIDTSQYPLVKYISTKILEIDPKLASLDLLKREFRDYILSISEPVVQDVEPLSLVPSHWLLRRAQYPKSLLSVVQPNYRISVRLNRGLIDDPSSPVSQVLSGVQQRIPEEESFELKRE